MRCIFGHWVLGFWRSVYWIEGVGYVCDRHAEVLERVGIGERTSWRR